MHAIDMAAMADSQMIEDQLQRILGSPVFAAAYRSQRFLRYVVERSIGERPDGEESLKEYTVAIDVFDRDANYDPAVDATVRVEAGRLRSRLREYYAEDGRNDRLLIEMPKGGYRVILRTREALFSGPRFVR